MDALLNMATYAVTVLVTIVISMTGYWLMIGRKLVTRDEAENICNDKVFNLRTEVNQYKFRIDDKIVDLIKQTDELKIVIDRNTEVITEFRIQMAILTKTLDEIQKRLND